MGVSSAASVAGAADGQRAGALAWVYDKWVTKPAQFRSERTFFRILDAAETLLMHKAWHDVSVQDIVAEAEASVGSFYNRFNDKAALLHCLEERLGQECELTLTALADEFEHCDELYEDADGIVVSVFMRLCRDRFGVIRALDLAQRLDNALYHGVDAKAQPGGPDDHGFLGIGLSFDLALRALSVKLAGRSPVFVGAGAATVHRALRETFWLARENLIYGATASDPQTLQVSLRQHLAASLAGPT